ncbi:MAG: GNAT family N-acetyltransferase [Bacteroidia bacterium]
MFAIREAKEKDIPVILHFIKAIADYEKLSHLVQATEESIKKTLFNNPVFAKCIIGYELYVPVGFALYFYNYSTFVSKPGIYLEDLFISTEHRGKGYGKALLLELVKIAKQQNCGRVEWSVLNWNKPAIDFYEKLGAKPLSEWTVYRLNEEDINRLG